MKKGRRDEYNNKDRCCTPAAAWRGGANAGGSPGETAANRRAGRWTGPNSFSLNTITKRKDNNSKETQHSNKISSCQWCGGRRYVWGCLPGQLPASAQFIFAAVGTSKARRSTRSRYSITIEVEGRGGGEGGSIIMNVIRSSIWASRLLHKKQTIVNNNASHFPFL